MYLILILHVLSSSSVRPPFLSIHVLQEIVIINLNSTPSMPIFGNRHRQKACLLTNTRMIHTHMFTINMIHRIFNVFIALWRNQTSCFYLYVNSILYTNAGFTLDKSYAIFPQILWFSPIFPSPWYFFPAILSAVVFVLSAYSSFLHH
jgi:hypothetical protein